MATNQEVVETHAKLSGLQWDEDRTEDGVLTLVTIQVRATTGATNSIRAATRSAAFSAAKAWLDTIP